MRTTLFAAATVLASSVAAIAAPASSTVGFTLTLSGNTNDPTFTLTNTSSGATTLDMFAFTIGDTAYNFDEVHAFSAPANMVLVVGDAAQSGARTDLFDFGFTGMTPSTAYSWATDVDRDNANTLEDYRSVFFNNGAAPNSVATAVFSDGSTLAYTLPDASSGASSYTFSPSAAGADVPLPAALPMLAAALGGLGLLRRRG